jgi:hypothetical protein
MCEPQIFGNNTLVKLVYYDENQEEKTLNKNKTKGWQHFTDLRVLDPSKVKKIYNRTQKLTSWNLAQRAPFIHSLYVLLYIFVVTFEGSKTRRCEILSTFCFVFIECFLPFSSWFSSTLCSFLNVLLWRILKKKKCFPYYNTCDLNGLT